MSKADRRWVLKHTLAAALAGTASPAWPQSQPQSWPQSAPRTVSAQERARLAAIANGFLKSYDMPGLSVAIAQHGALVYAEGFGVADKTTNDKVAISSLFRVASLSKPVTSVAIFSLIEKGHLRLTDKVFGAGAILGTEFGPARHRYVDEITVGHLLTHVAGGWRNTPDDPMDGHKNENHGDLISRVLKERPLDSRPGTAFAYSNFGYCVLGRVVERVSRQSYSDYVRQSVLSRCGITGMKIAGNSRTQRADGEVAYHHRSFDPYAINMTRNDSTGGWLGSATDLTLFAAHVSNFSHPPNILAPATIKTMTTPSAANPRYAHGWSVLKDNWRHDGLLPGSTATLVRTRSGYCWAAVTNSSSRNGNGGLDNMVWQMVRSIERWSPGEPPSRQG